ncbi:ankyrin repeat protein [Dictyocaulus viviparus]|uniref:Acyl-CoA-binding domain-containing protein 6 n=1 Tax=Dictyocaulus viviparus TaxID=29172 RepID=A0A0D8XB67_DICVI|nr:ankyrin repeat protein [Dictyocaulus viviparus]
MCDHSVRIFVGVFSSLNFNNAVIERTDRPSFFDVKANAKFKAWAQLNGMPKSVAMKTYIEKMVALNLGWNPSARCLSHGFGMHLSRPVKSSESLSDCSTAVTDREALLWFTAAKSDDVVTIMDIFERRPELLNQADQHLGMTALHWAIDSGCENVVRYLISKNADVNAIDPEDNTPLHFAAYCGRREAAEILISKGANRLLRNCDGQIPFEVCDDPVLQEILRPPSLL